MFDFRVFSDGGFETVIIRDFVTLSKQSEQTAAIGQRFAPVTVLPHHRPGGGSLKTECGGDVSKERKRYTTERNIIVRVIQK